MDELIGLELIYFWPLEGVFDVEKVAEAIASIGFSFRDEAKPNMFVVCPDEECRTNFSASRRADPTAGFPYMLLINVRPEKIYINQFAGPEFFDYSKQFMTWLPAHYACRVTDESGRDITHLLLSDRAATPAQPGETTTADPTPQPDETPLPSETPPPSESTDH